MRNMIAAAVIATVMAPLPALAQTPRQAQAEYRHDVRDAQRDYRHDVRDARRDRNRSVRDWRHYNRYDYNRFEPGQRHYYADRYYRAGSNYRVRTLGRHDRVYRGYNGRYYCRRSDGTTGLIVGGIAGGVLGNVIANGRSSLLGTLIGAGAGAALGSSIDRGNVRCR